MNIIQGDFVLNPDFQDVITVRAVRVLEGYRVRMKFSNNETRELDLKPYLRGPVFAALLQDASLFRKVFVDPETETLTWPTGVDMDPDTLYEDSVQVQVSQPRKINPVRGKPLDSQATTRNKSKKNTQTRPVVRLQAKQK